MEAMVSSRAEEVISYLTYRIGPHQMRAIGTGSFIAKLKSADFGAATIVDVEYGSDIEILTEEMNDSHIIQATLKGTGTLQAENKIYRMHPDNLLVSIPSKRARIRIDRASHQLMVKIDRDALEHYASSVFGMDITDPLSFVMESSVSSQLTSVWCELLLHMQQIHTLAPGFTNASRLKKHYSTLMMEFLLYYQPHNYSDSFRRKENDISPWYVRRARELIEHSLTDEFSVAELAREIGISLRSLQVSFQKFLGMSPTEYWRSCRLERLHEALLRAKPTQNIAALMSEVGILSFGRYARYYQKRYGCLPSDTLRRKG